MKSPYICSGRVSVPVNVLVENATGTPLIYPFKIPEEGESSSLRISRLGDGRLHSRSHVERQFKRGNA